MAAKKKTTPGLCLPIKAYCRAIYFASVTLWLIPVQLLAQNIPVRIVGGYATTDSAKKANRTADSVFIRMYYKKLEVMIPMRDGVRLYTALYIPRDSSAKYPIMLNRTPYNVEPYGPDTYLKKLGPSRLFIKERFIFAYQDVRGRYMSEGSFIPVRPYIKNKKSAGDIDESSDAYDTIEWLIRNLPENNGKVGIWGISAEGFYATSAAIDAHPALKAVSPQAPVTNWFLGDDRHHNGAFQEQGSFTYLSSFGMPRKEQTVHTVPQFADYGTTDIFQFYLKTGPLKNFNDRYFHHNNLIWDDIMAHSNYDAFWKSRTPEPHLKDLSPAMLVVGGFFDQEDLYGALKTHQAIENGGHRQKSYFVMGPWVHGGFSRFDGDSVASLKFGQKTAAWYRERIEFPFFMHYLKGTPDPQLPDVLTFESGSNKWRRATAWPSPAAVRKAIYLQPGKKLSFNKPARSGKAFSQYLSDPQKPVPYTSKVAIERGSDFMVEDQRFTAGRPDVLSFETAPLTADLTLAGPVAADLFVATTGTDADFVVKIIDVYPDNAASTDTLIPVKMNGSQILVRGEIMRSKFRRSFSAPVPMKPGKVTEVKWDMEDVSHCFLKGHRIMIQIQSSWFPLSDRNPQTFTDIYRAGSNAFHTATHRIYYSPDAPSHITVFTLQGK